MLPQLLCEGLQIFNFFWNGDKKLGCSDASVSLFFFPSVFFLHAVSFRIMLRYLCIGTTDSVVYLPYPHSGLSVMTAVINLISQEDTGKCFMAGIHE